METVWCAHPHNATTTKAVGIETSQDTAESSRRLQSTAASSWKLSSSWCLIVKTAWSQSGTLSLIIYDHVNPCAWLFRGESAFSETKDKFNDYDLQRQSISSTRNIPFNRLFSSIPSSSSSPLFLISISLSLLSLSRFASFTLKHSVFASRNLIFAFVLRT